MNQSNPANFFIKSTQVFLISKNFKGYASCQTNPAEQKYAPTELEVAALVFAVGHFETNFPLKNTHYTVTSITLTQN